MNLLVTGGLGFIGFHFIKRLLTQGNVNKVINVDAITYAANPDAHGILQTLAKKNQYIFFQANICNKKALSDIFKETPVDAIINFAAESHVDRSILNPAQFIETNIVGVQNLLDLSREFKIRFVQVSTDEVYGSLNPLEPSFTETSLLSPNSPYAASKACSDLLVSAYSKTYDLDTVITRCSNNYGPYQFPEKLIPLAISNLEENRPVPIYGDGLNVRDWIFVEDHCEGIECVLLKGKKGGVYNIGSENEMTNLSLIKKLLFLMDKPETLITYVKDRPAHDRRYSINPVKIEKELGWRAKVPFEEGLKKTVHWYLSNKQWITQLKNEAYRSYYKQNYQPKMGVETLL